MTWTAPTDRTTGTLITAAMWNQMLGVTGNIAETPAAKFTTAGDLFVATGANAGARLAMGSALQGLRVNAAGTGLEYAAPAGASGAAGGALAGTYPNPTLATLAQHLLFVDNTYDIGASGATRPRHFYLAGNAAIGGTLTAGSTTTAALTSNGLTSFGDIIASGAPVYPSVDNTQSCGKSSARWSVVYAATGTINTSSREAKRDIVPLAPSDALALVERTPIYTFNYKTSDPDLAAMRRVGFVAEDTDRLLSLDGKSADPQGTASLALAAIQALAAEVTALKAQIVALTTPPARPAQEGA